MTLAVVPYDELSPCAIGGYASGIAAIVGIIALFLAIRRGSARLDESLGHMLWLAHIIIFSIYGCIYDPAHVRPCTEIWCTTVRLHGVISVASYGIYRLLGRKRGD